MSKYAYELQLIKLSSFSNKLLFIQYKETSYYSWLLFFFEKVDRAELPTYTSTLV